MKNLNQTQTCQLWSDLHFKVLDCPLVEISPLAGRWKVKLDFIESVSGKLGSGNTCSGRPTVDGLRDSHRARGNGAGGRRTWGKLEDWLTRRQGGKIVFCLFSRGSKEAAHFLAQKAVQSLPMLSLHAVLYSTCKRNQRETRAHICFLTTAAERTGAGSPRGGTSGDLPRRPDSAGTEYRRRQRSWPSCWRESHDPERRRQQV